MPSFADQIPTIRKIYRAPFNWCARIFRAVFTWRVMRRVLLSIAILATLITSFYLEELWRGQRAWDAARRAFEAQGGTLDLQKLAPPPVPDDQNFAMTPLLKPFFPVGTREHPNKYREELGSRLEWPTAEGKDPHADDPGNLGSWREAKRSDLKDWQTFLGQPDILQALKKLDPVLNEISLASRRPFARFPFEYEKVPLPLIFDVGLFIHLTHIYGVRALAELDAGQTDRAAEDTVTIFQLANSLTGEPFLMSQITSVIIAANGMQVLWEGLFAHRWSEAQLVEFSGELQKFDYLAGELRGVQGETASSDHFFQLRLDDPSGDPSGMAERFNLFSGLIPDQSGQGVLKTLENEVQDWLIKRWAAWLPRGWLYQSRIVHLQDEQKTLATLDVPRHRVDPEKSKAIDNEFAQRRHTPYNFIAFNFEVGSAASLNRISASAQAWMDEAQVACALEHYRLANGQLPETLDQLTPKFIAKLPTDVISGGPLHYQRKADGHFLLYEVGWNGTDDGGVIAKDSSGNVDPEKGDWVWPDAAQP